MQLSDKWRLMVVYLIPQFEEERKTGSKTSAVMILRIVLDRLFLLKELVREHKWARLNLTSEYRVVT